jgi:hypothetical protein
VPWKGPQVINTLLVGICHCIYGENKVCHFAFALKEREENKKNIHLTISKWCNGGVFKESLSIIIMRGGRGRRVREWEWDEMFCAETWLRNILFCVLFLGSSISTFVLCWSILDQFLCLSLKSRERMSVYCGGGGGGGGGPITMFLLLVECLNFVSVASDVVHGLGQVDL